MMRSMGYALRHVGTVGLIAAVVSYIACNAVSVSFVAMLNQEQFYQAAVTFTTGAMIAIFLAVFYSDDKRIKIIRELPGALTIYLVVLFDIIIITLTGLFLQNDQLAPIIIVIFYVIHLVYVIARLVELTLRK